MGLGFALGEVRTQSRGASHHHEPQCVRRSIESPRAPRVAGHSLCSKWVRARVSNSAQTRTSSSDNERVADARAEERAKETCRPATKWKGEGVAKWAVLSLLQV